MAELLGRLQQDSSIGAVTHLYQLRAVVLAEFLELKERTSNKLIAKGIKSALERVSWSF